MKWFNIVAGENLADLKCPSCEAAWSVDPVFDHHVTRCLFCDIQLVELNMTEFIALVSYQDSPRLIRKLLKELQKLTEPEAYIEVAQLVRMLNAKTVL